MEARGRALKSGRLLSVTLWNKKEPPSRLQLYATHGPLPPPAIVSGMDISKASLYVLPYLLSTATVL